MGFFSRIFRPVAKLIDPLLPESVKSGAQAIDKALGGLSMAGAIFSGVQNEEGGGAPAKPGAPDIGRLEQGELDQINAKRLARIGRYFTTPLGVLSGANTGSQKVFS